MSDQIDPSQLEGDMVPQGRYKSARELKELHENTDLDVKGVLVNTFVLLALCVVTFIAIRFVMDYFVGVEEFRNEARLTMRFPDAPPPPQPNLQADPAKETRDEILKARERLESYGWVDRDKKTAHIPIERAIAILAEKGLPKGGKMDDFHPQQGSSNPVKVGEPPAAGDAAKPAEPAPAGEPAKAQDPEKVGEPAKPVTTGEAAPGAGPQP